MKKRAWGKQERCSVFFLILLLSVIGALTSADLYAFTVSANVSGVNKDGTMVALANFRWLIEEDNTNTVNIGSTLDPNSLSLNFHASHAPVIAKGDELTSAGINLPDGKRYFVSVLPDSGYTIGGAQIADGQAAVTVYCNQLPLPTAQITVFVFEDSNPINNAPEPPVERGLEGFTVVVADAAGRYGQPGGLQMLDVF